MPETRGRSRLPNALLIGPTGVGKTHTINVAAQFLRLPIVVVDSTTLVPAGAPSGSGQQLEDVAEALVEAAREISSHHAETLARYGIIFLDEFDKLAAERPEAGGVAAYAHWSRTIQRRLLKFIEGALTADNGEYSHVLVVASGAFAGIQSADILAKRPASVDLHDVSTSSVISSDIVAYGFIPELVARLPILINYEQLTRDDLLGIMGSKTVDPLAVWNEHFAEQGKTVRLTQEAQELVAARAQDLGMGARGVSQVLYSVLFPLAFRLEAADPGVYDIDEPLARTLLRGI